MSSTSPPTMLSTSAPSAKASSMPPIRASASPPRSLSTNSDWLGPSILTAKTVTAAADLIPIPYVKGAFGTAVLLLEAVEKMKRNREDLKELCQTTMETVTIIQEQVSLHGNTAAVKLKSLCEEFESFLQGVLIAIKKLETETRGFRGQVKGMLKASSVTNEIAGHQRSIQGLCSKLKLLAVVDTSFKVHEIHTAIVSSYLPVVQTNQIANNCPPSSRIFNGRREILYQMHKVFNCSPAKQHIYVLHGLGGAGKTQIALKFVEESSYFTDKFFLDASTTETIETGLKNMLRQKNVVCSSQDPLEWLTSKHENWLLLFDNAEDPKIDLNRFFPKCKHGSIIITSRNPNLRVYGAHSQVSDMDKSDAVELLLRSASVEMSDSNQHLAAEIVKAGGFISESGALDTYLELYTRNRAQLLSERSAQTHDGYSWTVYTTWQMSFDKLSPPAAMFLQLCSFFHRDGISEEIFSRAVTYSFTPWGPSQEELQKPLEFLSQFLDPTGKWDSLCFLKLTNEIKAYSLISFDPASKVFSIHPLVHSWSREILKDEESYYSCMCAILGMSIQGIPDQEMELTGLGLISHVDSLMHATTEVATDFCAQFANMYHHAGRYKEAKKLGIIATEKQRELFGYDHPNTLIAMHNLAITYDNLGESKEAEKLKVVVLDQRKKLLGDDHLDTIKAMNNLALTYDDLGYAEKAEKLKVAVLEKRRKLLGKDHFDTVKAMNNLAMTYDDLGRFQEAETLKLAVLGKWKRAFGDDHLDTLNAMHNLGWTYHSLRQLDKAEQLQIIVLEKRKKCLGDEHPDTLIAMQNLAITYDALHRSEESAKLKVAVLDTRKKLLGEDHRDTLKAINNLAMTYDDLGQYEESKKLKAILVDKQKKVLGDDHPDTLIAMHNLAITHERLEQFDETEKLEVVILEKRKKLFGNRHLDTVKAKDNLAITYYHLAQFKKAEKLQVAVLEMRKLLLGDNHPDTISAMHNLAMTYGALDELEKAEDLDLAVLVKQKMLLGDDHPETLNAMDNLAIRYHKLGWFGAEEEMRVELLKKLKKLLGDDHPDTLSGMDSLSVTYYHLEKFKQAEELQVAVLEKQRKLLDHGHPTILRIMQNLVCTYRCLNKHSEAKELRMFIKHAGATTKSPK